MDLSQNISITLGCTGLHKKDLFSKSDPYAILAVKTGGVWKDIGRTETLQNDHQPRFTHEFLVEYRFEEQQQCLITVMDDDYGKHKDDMLGQATFVLGTLMGSRGQKIRVPLRSPHGKPAGEVIVSAGAMADGGGSGDALVAKFACRGLDKKDWGPFASSDPFFIIEKKEATTSSLTANGGGKVDDESWTPIYRSEEIKKNLNPQWKEFSCPLRKLHVTGGAKLRIAVWDWDWDGGHDLIGYVENITLADILAQKKDLLVVHPPSKAKYRGTYQKSGLLDVITARIERGAPTFVEYLRGGLQMNLSVAIDFTGSNGDPNTPGTLHYGHGRTAVSPYMAAISAVGNIVLEYDSDKMIPVYGFGGRPSPSLPVSHCFPLNGDSRRCEVRGIEGIIDAYASTFDRGVVLSGPTHFAPCIRQAAAMSRSSGGAGYSILLLITDGAINDLQETTDAIVEASLTSPLSIIIVGVGSADFSSMDRLDADTQPLISSNGTMCVRDIVNFVPFNRAAADPAMLAKETLAELPDQVVKWFWTRKNQRPGASIETSDTHAMLVDVEIPTAVGGGGGGGGARVSAPPLPAGSLGQVGRRMLQTTL